MTDIMGRAIKRIVDNDMKWQGEWDDKTRTVKVNKDLSRKKSSIIDTIIHEEEGHVDHPNMSEKEVIKLAAKRVKEMSDKEKDRYYTLYKNEQPRTK